MKLISMTDFVLNVPVSGMEVQSIGIQGNNRYQKCIRYASFLKQPLELWMFAPVVRGQVIEEPFKSQYFDEYYPLKLKQYEEAKERCLFEGFVCLRGGMSINKNTLYITRDGLDVAIKIDELDFAWQFEFKTIEDLVKYAPELTQTAQKQIGCDH